MMKEYLEKRIKELEEQRDSILAKMDTWNERAYRTQYLQTMAVLEELKELKRIGEHEDELHSN